MANRMDIELTSARGDETFTWRAAGARQPKGVVPQSLVPSGSKVGDVLRAEVEVEIDGITIVAILPSKEKAAASGVIEHIGPERAQGGGVTTVLAGRGDRRGRGDRDRGDRDRGDRRRDGDRDRSDRRREGDRARGRGPGRPGHEGGEPSAARSERRERPREGSEADRPRGERTSRGPRAGAPRVEGERRRPEAGRPAARRGPARFEPGTTHRDELLAQVTPEQRPIAERLAAGGLPAVRKALADEQARARTEGRPVVSGEPIIAMAEQLLPDVKAAVWLDRAEGAVEHADEITLRELRATVVAASPRDEAGRELERRLRETLERRIAKLRQDWETHLTQALDDGRVLQALRLSAKPPEPTARFPAALVMRLADQAGQAMTADVAADRWLALLDAAADSPVRRQVKPSGMPKDEDGEVERRSRLAASRIPALAKLLGMAIPPPPKPAAGDNRRHAGHAQHGREVRTEAASNEAFPAGVAGEPEAPAMGLPSSEEPETATQAPVVDEAPVAEPVPDPQPSEEAAQPSEDAGA